jgi:hypothetical protein
MLLALIAFLGPLSAFRQALLIAKVKSDLLLTSGIMRRCYFLLSISTVLALAGCELSPSLVGFVFRTCIIVSFALFSG